TRSPRMARRDGPCKYAYLSLVLGFSSQAKGPRVALTRPSGTLSRRERGSGSLPLPGRERGSGTLPLPPGEGRGEGPRRARRPCAGGAPVVPGSVRRGLHEPREGDRRGGQRTGGVFAQRRGRAER